MASEKIPFDGGWLFHRGEVPFPEKVLHSDFYLYGFSKTGAFQGAASPDFDDSGWESVSLPHDWVIREEITPDIPVVRGGRKTGIGWYRKHFRLDPSDEGKRLLLVFDGMFRDSKVYLNGHYLGGEGSGYIPVVFDITDQADYTGNNLLAVRLDSSENEGWWYEGGGIYRHVRLIKSPPLHFPLYCACIRSEVETRNGKAIGPASVDIALEIANDGGPASGELRIRLLSPDGSCAGIAKHAFSAEAWDRFSADFRMEIEDPALWSLKDPRLYTLEAEIAANGTTIDLHTEKFGIRTAVFDVQKGFLLNGEPVKLQGVCNHQDHPGVGVAIPDKLHEFRIKRMREIGVNAWRCAHHPPAPEFLDACDRSGMLVMDETRRMNSTAEGLRQLEIMLKRDRNHPSIIIWSLGNEEMFCQGTETGARIIRTMKRMVRKLDPTRPVTVAMNEHWGSAVSAELDVQGFNYYPQEFDAFHSKFPKIPIIATESSPAFCTRGVFEKKPRYGHYSGYDLRKVDMPHCLTVEDAWRAAAERVWVLGEFTWPGFDYHGEPEPLVWPCCASNMGIVDSCGFLKDHCWYLKSWWSNDPVIHLLPHWNHHGRENEDIAVWCYSNCPQVELFLNGKSLGVKKMPERGHLEWDVPYVPGVLLARGFCKDGSVIEDRRETTGAQERLGLHLDFPISSPASGEIAVVSVSAMDGLGRMVPTADNRIEFEIAGPGLIAGVGNGDPLDHDPEQGSSKRLFNGLCQVLIVPTGGSGTIRLSASSGGLASAILEMDVREIQEIVIR